MVTARKLLLILLALLLLLTAWLWWNRPQKVDMAAYVPADSLVFIEANSLPRIAGDLLSTDAWKQLAPFDDVTPTRIHWLTRFAAWTGIGTAEAVIFARSQAAVALMDIDAGRAEKNSRLTSSRAPPSSSKRTRASGACELAWKSLSATSHVALTAIRASSAAKQTKRRGSSGRRRRANDELFRRCG